MRYDYLIAYQRERNVGAWAQITRARNLQEYSELFNYLQEHGIVTLKDLADHSNMMKTRADPVKVQMDELREKLKTLDAVAKAGMR